jgi:glycosyltransferase involved in cell wall biosynthesis
LGRAGKEGVDMMSNKKRLKKNETKILIYSLSEPKMTQGVGSVLLGIKENLPFNQVVLYPKGKIGKILFYSFLSPFWFALKTRKIKPDLVFVHTAEASFDPLIARKIFGQNYKVFTVAHGLNRGMLKAYLSEKNKGNTNQRFLFELNLRIATFRSKFIYLSDKVTAVSNFVKSELKRDYNTESTVISNGIFKTEKAKIKTKCEKIFFGGNLFWLKGLHYLIQANSQIKKPKKIVVAGLSKEQEEYLMSKFDCSSVEFKGMLPFEKFKKTFTECDAFAMPSLYESFGIVYLQALAYKIPVIASKDTGAEDIILNKKNGILVKKANVKELIYAINYLDKNIKRLSSDANFDKKFLWKNIAKKYKKQIELLMGEWK